MQDQDLAISVLTRICNGESSHYELAISVSRQRRNMLEKLIKTGYVEIHPATCEYLLTFDGYERLYDYWQETKAEE
jgi:hypothetical protein